MARRVLRGGGLMAAAALCLYGVWALLAFGLRAVLQVRRTGDSGFRGFHGSAGSAEWWAGVLFAVAVVIGVLAPVADLADVLEPAAWLDRSLLRASGVILAGLGMLGTLAAQLAMGDSWRVGVDPAERTALVTSGPFRVVRNPIFTAMLATAFGLAAMVPNVLALAGAFGLLVGLELHVRLVEEPYLSRVHGNAYAGYAARVGRFLPRIGLLQRPASTVPR